MKTIVDITPLESLRISQPFLFLPKGTGTWVASTPTWIPQPISPSRNFYAGKWSTCIQLLPSRVLGGGPHSRSKRGPWKHVFAMHEERSRESNLVPAPSSIGFSCCWTALFQPMLEKFEVCICYFFFPSSKLRSLMTTITLHLYLFLEGPWGQGWLNRHCGQTAVFPPQLLENGVNLWDWYMGQAVLLETMGHKGDKLYRMTSPGQRDRPGMCAVSLGQRMCLLILKAFLS